MNVTHASSFNFVDYNTEPATRFLPTFGKDTGSRSSGRREQPYFAAKS